MSEQEGISAWVQEKLGGLLGQEPSTTLVVEPDLQITASGNTEKEPTLRYLFNAGTAIVPSWSHAGPEHPWVIDHGDTLSAEKLPGQKVHRRRASPLTAFRALDGAHVSQIGTDRKHFNLTPGTMFGARLSDADSYEEDI